jgi:zinc transporter ZupT
MRRPSVALMLTPFLLLLPLVLVAQDSTAVTPSNPDGLYGLTSLLPWAGGLLGAWLFKKWNVAQGKLDGINDGLKAGAALVATSIASFLGDFLGVALAGDMSQWDLNFWTNLARGAITVLAVTVGITQAKEKAVTPSKATP